MIPCEGTVPNWMPMALLDEVGPKLSELYLSINAPMNISKLYTCLNTCPNLKVFNIFTTRFVIDAEHSYYDKVHLNPLPHLEYLRMETCHVDTSHHDVQPITKLVTSAPNLNTLEVLGPIIRNLSEIVRSGCLSEIQTLYVDDKMELYPDDAELAPEHWVFLCTHLTSLKILMVESLTEETLLRIRNDFRYTELQIVCRNRR